jgi:hypothetical protein
MKKAHRLGAKFVAIVGMMEAKNNICQLKNMELGTQVEIPLDALLDTVLAQIPVKQLDFYNPTKDFIDLGEVNEDN